MAALSRVLNLSTLWTRETLSACAAAYNKAGADELVFLDITASSESRDTMTDVVARVARQVSIPFIWWRYQNC